MIRHSRSVVNEGIKNETKTFKDSDNLAFFGAALDWLESRVGNEARGAIILIGQRDLPGIALRRAQSGLRWDRRPSLWSHVLILVQGRDETKGDVGALRCREVALASRRGTFPDPAFNGVTDVTLGDYASPLIDANVAVIGIPMTKDDSKKVLKRTLADPGEDPDAGVNLDRSRYDLWEMLGIWQGYLWTRGAPNPLDQGVPMFNAAFVAYCYEAIGLDITPGASERHAAPEHIWNGAKWWEPEFTWLKENGEAASQAGRAGKDKHAVVGYSCLRDPHCGVLDPDEIAAKRMLR